MGWFGNFFRRIVGGASDVHPENSLSMAAGSTSDDGDGHHWVPVIRDSPAFGGASMSDGHHWVAVGGDGGSSSFNPATGLPMMGGSVIDVAGNVYGTSSASSFGGFGGSSDHCHDFSSSSSDWHSCSGLNDKI